MESRNDGKPEGLSRRTFLQAVALGVVAGGAISGDGTAYAADTDAAYGMLIDTTLCRYCLKCVDACEKVHDRANPGTHYTDVVLMRQRTPERKALAVPAHCLHCKSAPCVKVCQGKALKQTESGAVTLDEDRCIGCLSCLSTCPFSESLHYDPRQKKVFKCDLCHDRITQGEQPACVEACAAKDFNALSFGSLDEMKQAAEKRVKEIDGVALYAEDTRAIVIFSKEDYDESGLRKRLGFGENYSGMARAKAGVTQFSRLGWLPVAGGLGLLVNGLRANDADDLVPANGEEE